MGGVPTTSTLVLLFHDSLSWFYPMGENRSPLEPQKLGLAERFVAVVQEAAAEFPGNLDAVDLVFAKGPGD